MTVLVTGASGFLGTAIVERLLAYKESKVSSNAAFVEIRCCQPMLLIRALSYLFPFQRTAPLYGVSIGAAYLKWRKNECETTKTYADRCGVTVASQAGRGERLTESKSSPALMQS